MKKDILAWSAGAFFLALYVTGEAQQPQKVLRVGYLSVNDAVGSAEKIASLRALS